MENVTEDNGIAGVEPCWREIPHEPHEWAAEVLGTDGEYYLLFYCPPAAEVTSCSPKGMLVV
jgi:hypothetical protein